MSLNMLMGSLSEGLLYSVMGIGILITFRFLNFADLTAEGSFTLGAAVAARLITSGYDPLVATLVSVLAGITAGLVTGFFHTVLRIPPLLSGILTMSGMYSINLRVMGRANVPLMRAETLMTRMTGMLGRIGINITNDRTAAIGVGLLLVALVIILLTLFFNTELGYALRATGNNENMVKAQGINTNRMKLMGLALGNACVALSGAMVCQFQNSADISMGVGTIVIGLAAVIIGEVLFKDTNNHRIFYAVIFGSIVFFIARAAVLVLGLAEDFRLFVSLLLALALSIPMIRQRLNINLKKLFMGRA
jgi:putative ABC transport system permease protein